MMELELINEAMIAQGDDQDIHLAIESVVASSQCTLDELLDAYDNQ